jgi:peptide/nickel transport system ATP-binding protein
MSAPLLEVEGLSVNAMQESGEQPIIEDVSFTLAQGEVLGLVGESGSGKTVTCRAIMRLLPGQNLRIAAGSIRLAGKDILALEASTFGKVRGNRIGMIFQNPASHLDPVMRIGAQIAESIRFHEGANAREAKRRATALLRQVGIPDPERRVDDFPHQFSGGMRQRAMIALALACNPEVLIADEPTTALDVTVQAQILRLLLDLRDTRGLSVILITHDLGIVAQTCDAIAVMYAGRIAERGPKREVLKHPLHPYTAKLIACQPAASLENELLPSIPGQPPSLSRMPGGCRFNPRCDQAIDRCRNERPALLSTTTEHLVACHLAGASSPPPLRGRTAAAGGR